MLVSCPTKLDSDKRSAICTFYRRVLLVADFLSRFVVEFWNTKAAGA